MLKKLIAVFIGLFLFISLSWAQESRDSLTTDISDTISVNETITVSVDPFIVAYFKDSVSISDQKTKEWLFDRNESFISQLSKKIYKFHAFYNFKAPKARKNSDLKKFEGKEIIFYTLIGLVILFGIFKMAYTKYLKDLFRLFFRTTLKYGQISELLLQNPLPSLLLNFFFVLSGAFYISTLLFHLKLSPIDNFWLLFLNSLGLIAIVYLVKYIVLKLSGWLFNIKTATDSYIFIVFIVNKIVAIYLLPFIILISFSDGKVQQVAFTLSWVGLVGFLVYRFILSYGSIRNIVKVNPFHFLLYLSAVEIAPLLILYKMILSFI